MKTIVDLIEAKQAGRELSTDDLRQLVLGFHRNEVPEYQMAAFLMAVYFKGMTRSETTALLEIMVESGERLHWEGLDGPVVDKHSTGGVGDKISLMLAPILVADGCYVPMISGRGLGHTGGTLDKLDSIPGFQTRVPLEDMKRLLPKIGCVLAGQTAELAPADRRMYSLRDVTGTVRAIPLITASVLSKKLSEGLDGLVIDLKLGRGAFATERDFAWSLAESLHRNATNAGISTRVVLTAMDVPIGRTVGNWLETRECIDWLANRGEEIPEVTELTLTLGAQVLDAVGKGPFDAAYARLAAHRKSGRGFEIFRNIVSAQGGDVSYIDHPDKMPVAPCVQVIHAPRDGYLNSADALRIGKLSVALGAGRRVISDDVDPLAGFRFLVPWGEAVKAGDALMEIHCTRPALMEYAMHEAVASLEIEPEQRSIQWILSHYRDTVSTS